MSDQGGAPAGEANEQAQGKETCEYWEGSHEEGDNERTCCEKEQVDPQGPDEPHSDARRDMERQDMGIPERTNRSTRQSRVHFEDVHGQKVEILYGE